MTTVVDPLVLLGSAAITFLTGKYIESAGSAPGAQLAKAQALLAISEAIEEMNAGQASGVQALQTAISNLVNNVKDPAAQMALNELLAVVDTELGQLAGGTLLGKLQGMAMNLIVTQIVQTAQAYVNALTPPPAAA